MQKCAKNAKKKKLNIENILLARYAYSGFYKIHISGAANRHAQVQFAKYVFFFFFFFSFFLSSHHDTNPLLLCIIFVKTYNYILAYINSESSRVIFSFFFSLHLVGQTFLYPSIFCNHLKHSAK